MSSIFLLSIDKQIKNFFEGILASIDHIIFQCTLVGLLLRIYFGVLVLIETLLIVELFVCIDRISVI